MELVRKTNNGSYAKVLKRVKFAALALVLVFGAVFISCNEPADDAKPGVTNAKQPNITAQPADGFWNVFPEENSAFNLTVTANVTDGGSLSYQWYSNTSKSANGGAKIAGGTGKTLSLNKNNYTANGSNYFYAEITNTNNNVDGTKTAVITSSAAEIYIVGNPDTAYSTSAMPEFFKGTWNSEYGEIFIIDNEIFTSKFGADTAYAGTIAGHRSNKDGDGYITIKYTENSGFIDSINKFYVIHYKELLFSEVTLAGASLGADSDFEYGVGPGGKTTQAEAEAVMTVSAGYFDWYSILTKEGYTNADHPHISAQPAGGNWNISVNNTHTLTVAANINDNGTLSYQWYSNTSASNSGGTIMSGKTSAVLQLEKASYTANGGYYFYVVVTNINNAVNGNITSHTTSNVVTVTVSGNSAAFQLPAEFIGTWDGGYDFNIFEAPDIMWNTWDGTTVWIKVKVMEIAALGDEMLLYGKFLETDDYFGMIGHGDYSAIYIKKYNDTKWDILQLALAGENTMGYDYGQPMYETLEAVKAGLPLNNSFRDTYVSYPVTYTKQ